MTQGTSLRGMVAVGLLLVAAVAWWWCSQASAQPVSAPGLGHATSAEVAAPVVAKPSANATVAAPAPAATNAEERQPVVAESLQVLGVLTRLGMPIAGRLIELHGGGDTQEQFTDAAGAFRFPVASGRFRVKVPLLAGEVVAPVRSSFREPPSLAESGAVSEFVEVHGESVCCDLSLPPGSVTLRLLDAQTALGVPNAQVALRSSLAFEIVMVSDGSGRVRYEDLEPRSFQLVVAARGYSLTHATVDLSPQTPFLQQDLTLEPVGALDVRLLDARGQPVAVSAAMRVEVWEVESNLLMRPSNGGQLRGETRPTQLCYDDLDAGRHRIVLASEEAGERMLRYQPIDPIEPLEVDVALGQLTAVEVPVRYRAYVRLRGHDAEDQLANVTLAVETFDPLHGTLRVLPAPWQRVARSGDAHFEGYLPPGVYSLTFEAGKRQHRETLVVDRQNIDRTFRLPW